MKKITVITTNEEKNQYWDKREVEAKPLEGPMNIINIYPEVKYQSFHGFGGAITEAAAHIYHSVSKEKQQEIIEACYGDSGLRYNMARIHMNSCDFALGNYTYIEEGDAELKTFDIEHDRKEILPMIKEAIGKAGNLTFLMSPWSPPAFMKTNNEMNNGGSLKEEYYEAWANYFVRFIQEYKKEGVDISYVTVQNEPLAKQAWDSCVYTSEQEGRFAREFLGPKLEEAGLGDIKIFIWDLNKEESYNWTKQVLSAEGTDKYVKGTALHWYTGDHFETIEMIRKMFPNQEVFFTEGCVEYSRFADSGEIQKAEMYAHDIIGNLNAGVSASIDWNLLLDHLGGPNHVGNFCAAPIMCEVEKDSVEKRLSYYYIGQFSRYIKKDAVKIGTTKYTADLDVLGFLNPDGERVIVVLNKSEKEQEILLMENGEGIKMILAPHSIQTFCYQN